MTKLLTTSETARRWGISQRRVLKLLADGRVPEAQRIGNMWVIPEGTERPKKRINRYQ